MAVGFKISKTCRYVLTTSLPLLLMAGLVPFNTPEAAALLWHLRYGFKERCCGVRIDVPLKYFGDFGDRNPRSIFLLSTPGYLRWRFFRSPHASIQLIDQPQIPNEEQTRLATERFAGFFEEMGYRLVATKTIEFTRNPLRCSELYIERLKILGPDYEVFCWGREPVSIHYADSPALLNEFYSIVQGAQTTGKPPTTNAQ